MIAGYATAWAIPSLATETVLTVPTVTAENAAVKANGNAPPAVDRANATIATTDSVPPAAVYKPRLS